MINWKTEKKQVADLKLWRGNPRTITKKGYERLKKRITERGFHDVIKINIDNTILSGNQRKRALVELGIKEVECKVPERKLTEKEMKRVAWESNMNDGEWDFDMLANEDLDELTAIGFDDLDRFRQVEEDEAPIKDIKDIKILNLYAGIGGNRKLWGDLNITAIEYNEEIAKVYKDYFPKDKVIITNAHKYLEKNFADYDFIWSNPPCPTHSKMRKWGVHTKMYKPIYPDMALWQEILFLQGYFKGKWVVENVKTWYDPLIEPQERGRHYYWSNFDIPELDIFKVEEIGNLSKDTKRVKKWGFDLSNYTFSSKYPRFKILRNMVYPKTGKFILESAYDV